MNESSKKEILTRCSTCGWSYLYLSKHFNKKLGCAILIIGALLSPKTFGFSLAACALLDAWLYRRLKYDTVCYICGTCSSNAPINPEHKEFDLALDEGYERIRAEWRLENRRTRDEGRGDEK